MKTISASQREALEDMSAEGLLGNLPVQTAEKDIHITDLLRALSSHRVFHDLFRDLKKGEDSRHDAGIKLVFAGGTCLSKAHGAIQRMSEDVDIKVILEPLELRKNRGARARLIALHDSIEGLLTSIGLPMLKYPDGESNPSIAAQHGYYLVGAGYRSAYPQLASLRPEVKLELMARTPVLPVEERTFGYLHESLAGREFSAPVTISCISVAETAAEKVLSLLRRCAFKWTGGQRGEMDPALVRHVYDVSRILDVHPAAISTAKEVFAQLVEGDRAEYGRRHPSFSADPYGVLKDTLALAKDSEELEYRYNERLMPLLYDGHVRTYSQAFEKFELVAGELLNAE